FVADLVTINNGATLRFEYPVSSPGNLGIVLGSGAGGQIDAAAAVPVSLTGVISGTSLTKGGTGTLGLGGANTYTGTTTVRGGPLRLDANAPAGAAGALGNATSAVVVGDDTGSNNAALLVGVNNVSVGRDITVVASSSATPGTVMLGATNVVDAASFTGTVPLNRSVVLEADSSTANVTFGRITGTGGVTKSGPGTVTLNSTASDFSGTVTLAQGALAIDADAKLGAAGNALVFTGGTLTITGTAPLSTARTITLPGNGTIDVENTDTASGFTLLTPVASGTTLTKTGAGILTLGGSGTYFVGLAAQAGTV